MRRIFLFKAKVQQFLPVCARIKIKQFQGFQSFKHFQEFIKIPGFVVKMYCNPSVNSGQNPFPYDTLGFTFPADLIGKFPMEIRLWGSFQEKSRIGGFSKIQRNPGKSRKMDRAHVRKDWWTSSHQAFDLQEHLIWKREQSIWFGRKQNKQCTN